jgi:hypothetical protein
MSSHEGTPLTVIPGWKKAYAKKLADRWITTAEQVVGIGATPEGVQTLAHQLGVSSEEAQRLLERARDALPPTVAAELEKAVDTSEYGLGALPPEGRTSYGPRSGGKKPRKRDEPS